ncbi:hypothetical protein EF902_28285 [Streptomyces sp. WAC05858]|nr:hypothetical protein EF902_28285 [Streptomyces sp. WAC05858]
MTGPGASVAAAAARSISGKGTVRAGLDRRAGALVLRDGAVRLPGVQSAQAPRPAQTPPGRRPRRRR